ncbi:hypothetical protein EVAR_54274_1 [Eumeta japonica]|uniref:Uncharacterized protein n=1 Tax=Eumeta variegata TaxID=151549 RepID=A0A4C1YN54_EUMVA|nr:hypothetical protein EVAR_54274_1 [Eumeta japonica]
MSDFQGLMMEPEEGSPVRCRPLGCEIGHLMRDCDLMEVIGGDRREGRHGEKIEVTDGGVDHRKPISLDEMKHRKLETETE